MDPFEAKHGRYSVRMTVPGDNQSIGLIPTIKRDHETELVELSGRIPKYYYSYVPGDQLTVSIWAKAKEPGLTMRLSDGAIEGFPKEFALTTEWQRYEATGTVNKKRNYPGLSFHLMSKGTAWFDMMEVTCVPAPKPVEAVPSPK